MDGDAHLFGFAQGGQLTEGEDQLLGINRVQLSRMFKEPSAAVKLVASICTRVVATAARILLHVQRLIAVISGTKVGARI